jgi:uncharacterized protein (TIGR00369 family)
MRIEDIGIGYSIIKMDVDQRHYTPFQAIHGGVYETLIDTACYWAVYAELDENIGLISMDVNVNNLASVNQGHLTIKGKRIKVGRTTCLAEATIRDQNDKILAHGSSKLLLTQGLQTIETLKTLNSIDVPVKFI